MHTRQRNYLAAWRRQAEHRIRNTIAIWPYPYTNKERHSARHQHQAYLKLSVPSGYKPVVRDPTYVLGSRFREFSWRFGLSISNLVDDCLVKEFMSTIRFIVNLVIEIIFYELITALCLHAVQSSGLCTAQDD